MASHPRSTVSEASRLEIVPRRRNSRQRRPTSMKGRIYSTVLALAVLALVLRYLPPSAKHADAPETTTAQLTPADLIFSDVQISQAPKEGSLYVDGMVTNQGKAPMAAAEVQVGFRDAQGQLIASVQTPLGGMAHGTADVLPKEFARNPIAPSGMRVFRVAVPSVPAGWNHEVPEIKVVAVQAY